MKDLLGKRDGISFDFKLFNNNILKRHYFICVWSLCAFVKKTLVSSFLVASFSMYYFRYYI